MADLTQSAGLARLLYVLNADLGRESQINLESAVKFSAKKFRETIDTKFPAMYSINGIDVYNTILLALKDQKVTPEDGILLIIAFNRTIESLSNKYEFITEATFTEIENAYLKLVKDFNTAIVMVNISGRENRQAAAISKKAVEKARQDLETIRTKKFSTPYKVYAHPGTLSTDSLLGYYKSITSKETLQYRDTLKIGRIKLVVNSFSNFRSVVNNELAKQVNILRGETVTKKPKEKVDPLSMYDEGIKEIVKKSTVSTKDLGEIFQWGHTAVTSKKTAERTLVTSKLLSEILTKGLFVSVEKDKLAEISLDFQKETTQIRNSISFTSSQKTEAVAELVVKSPILQSVLAQYGPYNEKELGKLEKSYNLLDRLKDLGFKSTEDIVGSMFWGRLSPSLGDRTLKKLKNIFDGVQDGSDVTKPVQKKLNSVKNISIYKPKGKVKPNTKGRGSSHSLNIRTTRSDISNTINLSMLMLQINNNLHDQIKANMGTGNRRDVLNYRTGRFAQSARVERISESRQGMITAFYSYMKNPYATFSRGGRQERPYTRDPKTLISKSIRELAGQQVANRMRAVLI